MYEWGFFFYGWSKSLDELMYLVSAIKSLAEHAEYLFLKCLKTIVCVQKFTPLCLNAIQLKR